ncbi:unnamed protein product [Vitrella brassicaformis CCMP3155]|uniref:Apple domain-containing protein n=3 Tax=Vitrella brassicaformis TaxID=1169539 RepID=A0A0G4EGD8_VITBC|nr:unnamed protein product [Vitrella brassicaformis CCMP3155]|eukprot:CEL94459.1 unnamed protein product [Vitrella brassicaformis CCMP3155]
MTAPHRIHRPHVLLALMGSACFLGLVQGQNVQTPEDVECAPDGRRSGICFGTPEATVAPPPNASCYEWDFDYEGYNLSEPVIVSTTGINDVDEAPSVGLDVNALGHMVARPYDCQRGCQAYDACKGWTFSRIKGCFLKSSDAGRRHMPEETSENGIANWYVSGGKYSMDCDRGAFRSPCFEYNVACLFSNTRHHYREGVENITLDECHDLCKGVPGCLAFTFFDRFPRDERVIRNVCQLCGQKDRKVCQAGAIMGWVEGHDCGPAPGSTWPPPPVPPLTHDGMHQLPADPALYYGLPTEPNALAAGKKGTKEERSFHRGDLGAPSFLTKSLNYAVRAYDLSRVGLANCGCYHQGVQPDPDTSTMISNIDLLVYPAEGCQELCREEPDCEAFSSSQFKCMLWKNVTSWRLDQVEPIVVSGPRLCPGTIIDQGYACSLDHYRARFSSLSLLVLRMPGISVPYGQSCPTDVDLYVIVFLLAAGLLTFAAYVTARQSKKHHPSTVVWRVVAATVAGLGTVAHVVFVIYLFRVDYTGWLFWAGCIHFLCMILFNEITVVLYNLTWVTSHPSYALTFSRAKRDTDGSHKRTKRKKTILVDIQAEQQPLKQKAATFLGHMMEPPPAPDATESDIKGPAASTEEDVMSFCPTFALSHLSTEAVFCTRGHMMADLPEEPPVFIQSGEYTHQAELQQQQRQHEEQDDGEEEVGQQEAALEEIDTAPTPEGIKSTKDTTPICSSDVPKVFKSCPPAFAAPLESATTKSRESTCKTVKEEDASTDHAVLAVALADEKDDDAFGGDGAGLVFVLFGSFFSIGVLHLGWSNFRSLPYFSIPVKSEAFRSLELMALVGYVPMLTLQLLAVFLSDSDGVLADIVPPATLTALLLTLINTCGVIVRYMAGRCSKA